MCIRDRNEGGSVPVFDDEIVRVIARDEPTDPWPINSRSIIPQMSASSSLEMSPNRQPSSYFHRVGIARVECVRLVQKFLVGRAVHTPVETLRVVDCKMTLERIRWCHSGLAGEGLG